MILSKALAVGLQLMVPVAANADDVPKLNVEQVCEGIAKQGGVTFHDPAIAQEKKNCLDSEQAIRDELVKQWPSFSPADKTHCVNELVMGGEVKLHRTPHLSGNGARRQGHADRAGKRGERPE